jgi:hypothetical protein
MNAANLFAKGSCKASCSPPLPANLDADGMILSDFDFLLRSHVAVETLLREALRQRAMNYIREYRLPDEAITGYYSDAVAQAGLKYLMNQQDLAEADEVMILDQVGRNLCALGDVIGEAIVRHVGPETGAEMKTSGCGERSGRGGRAHKFFL